MCLKKKKSNNIEQMIDYLRTFMIEYLAAHAEAGDDVVNVFTQTKKNLMQYPERQMAKEMKKQHLNVEATVLNILQNHALMFIVPQTGVEYILSEGDDSVHTLYDVINDIKLEKRYITKYQYDQNKKLGERAGLIPPGGRWL